VEKLLGPSASPPRGVVADLGFQPKDSAAVGEDAVAGQLFLPRIADDCDNSPDSEASITWTT
jgi:hypothetical protein